MIEIVEKNKCVGCTSCMNICPKKAIKMLHDKDGFIYPVVDQDKCINCGLCKKTCPVLTTKNNITLKKCFIAYTKDLQYKKNSSSGGIFPILATKILDENGIVIGATFDKDKKLKHFSITDKKDLNKLEGSKYLQSDLEDIFTYIKEKIKNQKVLFVGTPCQVAGLKSFLNKEHENLICIDLFCHGVPSPKLFEKYVNELEKDNNDILIDYKFRDKATGWDSYSNTALFKNSTRSELQINNNYMKLFLSDVSLRESCFNCNFKLENKYSDLTLGDFWGIKQYYPEMYDKQGVSAVIVNTLKGEKVFNSILGDLNYKECNINEITHGNPCLIKSVTRPNDRDIFFNDIDKMDIPELVKKYVPKKSFISRVKNKIKSVLH